jgi:hypothetical protein
MSPAVPATAPSRASKLAHLTLPELADAASLLVAAWQAAHRQACLESCSRQGVLHAWAESLRDDIGNEIDEVAAEIFHRPTIDQDEADVRSVALAALRPLLSGRVQAEIVAAERAAVSPPDDIHNLAVLTFDDLLELARALAGAAVVFRMTKFAVDTADGQHVAESWQDAAGEALGQIAAEAERRRPVDADGQQMRRQVIITADGFRQGQRGRAEVVVQEADLAAFAADAAADAEGSHA